MVIVASWMGMENENENGPWNSMAVVLPVAADLVTIHIPYLRRVHTY